MAKKQNTTTPAVAAAPTFVIPAGIPELEFWSGSAETGYEWNGLRMVRVEGGWSVLSGEAERRAESMNNVPYVSPRRAIAALRVIAKQ